MFAVWDQGQVRFVHEASWPQSHVSWSARTQPGGDFRGVREPSVNHIVFVRLKDEQSDQSPAWTPPMPTQRVSIQLFVLITNACTMRTCAWQGQVEYAESSPTDVSTACSV